MATLRQATSADLDALAALNRPAQELHVEHRPDRFKPADASSAGDWFRTMLQDPAVRIWIAESDGLAVGYTLTVVHERPENAFGFARRFCEIDQIAVSPEFRGRGIARALVERVLEDARERAIDDIELSSWTFNTGAHEAFRALGFTPRVVRFARKSS